MALSELSIEPSATPDDEPPARLRRSLSAWQLMFLVFSVGYVVMSRETPDAGSFYNFIARGFGVTLGLGSAYVAVLFYDGGPRRIPRRAKLNARRGHPHIA